MLYLLKVISIIFMMSTFSIMALPAALADPAPANPLPFPPDNLPIFTDNTLLNKDVGLNALVRLEREDGYSCTGVAFRTNNDPTAPAYLLSAGHCYALLEHETIVNASPVKGTRIKALFNRFHDAPANERFAIAIKRTTYATMRGQDISILELNTTQGELAKRNILLPSIASSLPTQGLTISTYGNRSDQPLMKALNCKLIAPVHLNEGVWAWWNVLSAECKHATSIAPGASGSPVYQQGTAAEFFGILTTANLNKPNLSCNENNPCELTKTGARSQKNGVYFMNVSALKHCFTPQGKFQLSLKHCPLPKHVSSYTSLQRVSDPSISYEEQALFATQSRFPNPHYQQARARYVYKGTTAVKSYHMELLKPENVTTQEAYRYKLTALVDFNPTDPNGYSEPTRAAQLTLNYPSAAGTYITTVIPERNFNLNHLNPLALYTHVFEIVYSNPLKINTVKVVQEYGYRALKPTEIRGNATQVNSIYALAYQIGSNPNCADFSRYTLNTDLKTVNMSLIPKGSKVCLSLVDRALNGSEPFVYTRP